jgi:ferric-dicitrate binding protein FerR (iron transport regulator)
MDAMAKTPAQRIKKHGANAAVPQHHLPAVINPGTEPDSRRRHRATASLIVIAGVVASLFLFWYLHLLTLNQLTQLSGVAWPCPIPWSAALTRGS